MPIFPYIGLESTMTLRILSLPANNAKTIYHLTQKSHSSKNQAQTDHFKRLLWTSVPMLAVITSSLLTVILTGQPSSPWVMTPQPHKSSQPSGYPSAALRFQISYGLMKDPSLNPRSLLTFYTNGASYTRSSLHIILKVTVR